MNGILLIRTLWKEYLVLFELSSIYSYVTTFFIQDIVLVWFTYVFHFYGCIPSGGSDVPILLYPLDRVCFLGRLGHLNYDRFDVVWDSLIIPLYLSTRLCLWELIEELPCNVYGYMKVLLEILHFGLYHLLDVYFILFFFAWDKFESPLMNIWCLKVKFL